jgi:hypothetical protein
LGQHGVLVQHEAWDEEKHRHAQEWIKKQRASLEREIGRQEPAVARDTNEIARSAAYAASDAVRSQAHIAEAPLIIATIALFVSIITPEKIAAYVSKPWVSWPSPLQSGPSDDPAAPDPTAGSGVTLTERRFC